jgi:hypothetical protein
MSVKTDRLFSLRRLSLLALATVLTCLALAPSLTACTCTEGSIRTVFTSIECCSPPQATRPGERQQCQSCQWKTISTGCYPATCAY